MKFLFLLCILLLLCGCASSPDLTEDTTIPTTLPTEETTVPETPAPTTQPTEPPDPLQELLNSMTLEERVGQLFLARCNSATAVEDVAKYHLGGYVLFGIDFEGKSPESVTAAIASYQEAARIPLLIAVDEEGGTVTRVSRYSQFRSTPFQSPRNLYSQGGLEKIRATEEEKCALLSSLGINVNLGPVCDISTQPGAILYQRSLGQSPEITSEFIVQTVRVMEENHIDEIKGVYVPFWLFDADADAHMRYRATKVRTWSDSEYHYTETRYYALVREGGLGFSGVPVDGSSKIPNDLMESIEPYDLSQAVDFQTAYLAGYLADKYDVDADQSFQRANERIRQATEEVFASTVLGYTSAQVESSSIRLSDQTSRYALLPVWLLNTSWNGKKYTFAMNGQTGKMVGDLPMDKSLCIRWLLGLAGAIGGAIFALSTLMWLL